VIRLELSEVVAAIEGRPWGKVPTGSVGAVSTDSRTAGPDDVFFALRGPRFDGHDYVVDALRRGALAAVVEQRRAEQVADALRQAEGPIPGGVFLIEVADTVAALGRLAAFHRRQLSAEVIAVVGSNGKTTTKAMIHHILSGRLKGRSSPKSYNNEIGVPLTLLSAESGDDYLVVEIGTNAPGEVAALAEITQPGMAVVTCIGEEHLERLGDLHGVAAEETAVLSRLRANGFAAVNVDEPIVREYLPESGVHVATFGCCAEADVRLDGVRYEQPWLSFRLNERFDFRLRVPGVHNAVNAAGAVTIARRFGLDYEEAAERLTSFVLPPMRNEVVETSGVTIVNDAYNANPQSAVAAIETLEQMPCKGQRIAVFGEMRELGEHSAELHRKVAQRLRDGNVQRVILVGEATGPMFEALSEGADLFGPSVERSPTVEDCLQKLATGVRAGDVVLLKASRAVELDRLMEPLKERLGAAALI
jgi:UDP-N-acetylmuramoyl-tripeptide--D-alanyl-D-alanine ligase